MFELLYYYSPPPLINSFLRPVLHFPHILQHLHHWHQHLCQHHPCGHHDIIDLVIIITIVIGAFCHCHHHDCIQEVLGGVPPHFSNQFTQSLSVKHNICYTLLPEPLILRQCIRLLLLLLMCFTKKAQYQTLDNEIKFKYIVSFTLLIKCSSSSSSCS